MLPALSVAGKLPWGKIAVVGVLLALAGWQYVGKIKAQRAAATITAEYADFKTSQAQLAIQMQQQINEEKARADKLAKDISKTYNEAVRATSEYYKGQIDSLETTARYWAQRSGGLRVDPDSDPGGGGVPTDTGTSDGLVSPACAGRLFRVTQAAQRVAADLETCTEQAKRLSALITWHEQIRPASGSAD